MRQQEELLMYVKPLFMGYVIGVETQEEEEVVAQMVANLKTRFPNWHGPSAMARCLNPEEVCQIAQLASRLPLPHSTKEVLLRDVKTGEILRIEPGHTSVYESLAQGHTMCEPVEIVAVPHCHVEVP
jgi:hypothetical protein